MHYANPVAVIAISILVLLLLAACAALTLLAKSVLRLRRAGETLQEFCTRIHTARRSLARIRRFCDARMNCVECCHRRHNTELSMCAVWADHLRAMDTIRDARQQFPALFWWLDVMTERE